jgi:serine/threonine protein kinase
MAKLEEQKLKQLERARRRNRNKTSSIEEDNIRRNFDPRLEMSQAGTVCYMAPEMAKTGHPRANKKVDVWSLGLIFIEIATGQLLLDNSDGKNATSKKWLRKKLNMIPLHYACRKPLCALITSCLEVNPDKRCSMNDIMVNPLIAVSFFFAPPLQIAV